MAEKATLWLWELKDLAVIGIGLLLSVLALMKLRERNRQGCADQEIMEAELAKLTAGMEVSQEDRLMLQMVLQVLSEEELQIVMLHAVAGCKHREIAQLLELPLPTVLSKYHRALKKLRKQWEEGNE